MTELGDDEAPIKVSAARAALAVPAFRTVFLGAFASAIGTWMQNVTLGAFAYRLTGSPTFVGITLVAQLGPLLLLSIVGGVLADLFDRRRLIVVSQLMEVAGSLALALVATSDDPSRIGIVASVTVVGIGFAINGPAWSALLPSLVPSAHLAGAVSLNSTQVNAARVVGPAIAGVLYPMVGAAGVFAINAATYLFSIGAVLRIASPAQPVLTAGVSGLRRVKEGLSVVRRDPVVRRVLVTMVLFSLLCLPFIGQLPTIAEENLGLDTQSLGYGLLYACFGIGTVAGAVSIGTFLSGHDQWHIVRLGMGAFAVMLGAFALIRGPALAYPVVIVLGFAYFATVTSITTVLQTHVSDQLRGRVMSLWQMAFGGAIPIGHLIAGPVAEATSATVMVLYGVIAAVGLTWYVRRPEPLTA